MSKRVISYRRVSTDEQTESGNGLAAQANAVEKAVHSRDWNLTLEVVDEGVSGSIAPSSRRALGEALDTLRVGDADVLMVAKLDRATRSVGDLCELLDLSERQGWDFVALDLGIDTSTPMGRAMAQMASVFAELERKMIAQRTSDALQAKKAAGQRLGRPVELNDALRQRIAQARSDGASFRSIASKLNTEGVPTARGGAWHASTIRRVVQSVALDSEVSAL